MYPFNIEKTQEKYYTPLPGAIVTRIQPWLDRNGVDYEVLSFDDLVGRDGFEKIPQAYTFRGRTSMLGCVFVYANLRSEDLVREAEKIFRHPTKDI